MFGVVPKILWSEKYPADEDNLCNWALRSLLIDTGERVILIDNGYGDKQSKKFFSHVHLNGGDGESEITPELAMSARTIFMTTMPRAPSRGSMPCSS